MINLMNKDIFIPDGYDEVYIEYDGVSIKYHLKKYKNDCKCSGGKNDAVEKAIKECAKRVELR